MSNKVTGPSPSNLYMSRMCDAWSARIKTLAKLPLEKEALAHFETVAKNDLADTALALDGSPEGAWSAWADWYPAWIDRRVKEELPRARLRSDLAKLDAYKPSPRDSARARVEAFRDREMAYWIVNALEETERHVCELGHVMRAACGDAVRRDTYRRFARVVRGLEASNIVVSAIAGPGALGLKLVGKLWGIDPHFPEPWEGARREL